VRQTTQPTDLPAGEFSAWLRSMRAALAGDGGTAVPCGACSACCTSSHFVHIGRVESATLERIPRELQFPAPGLPTGDVVLGYDEQGRCPLLRDGRCSVYAERPLTCRVYDCRVFAAAGIAADCDPITRQARRWAFSYPARRDRDEHAAVQAAARFVRERAECFPGGQTPRDPVTVALLAIKAYDVFLETGGQPGAGACTSLDQARARAILEANQKFEAASARPGSPG
jgi:uncharacterized protein